MLFLIRFSIYYVFSLAGFAILAFVPVWFFNGLVLSELASLPWLRMLTPNELAWSAVFVGVVGTLYMLIVESLGNRLFRNSLGNTMEITENDDDYAEVYRIFSEARSQFRLRSAKLYVADAEEINAYAIQSPTKKAVVFTTPLLDELAAFWQPERSEEQRERYYGAIEGIIAHELSHLKHNDYIPSWFFYGTIRLADLIRAAVVQIIQVLIHILVIIPFVGGLIALALGLATRLVNFISIKVFFISVPKLIRLLDALPMRIVEQRCDNHAATLVGAGPVFLGLYSLAHLGVADRLRILDDHPPTIVRVARVYSRLTRPSVYSRKIMQSMSFLNGALATTTVVLFLVMSGAASLVAADHLGFTNSQADHPVGQTVARTSRDLSQNTDAMLASIGASIRPVAGASRDTIRPAFLFFSETANRLAEFLGVESTTESRASRIAFGALLALVAVVLVRTVGVKVIDLLLAMAFLPYRLILKSRENKQDDTELDHLFYGAVDANSLIGVLALLKHGANKCISDDEYGSPLEYALQKRRYRLAVHLAF